VSEKRKNVLIASGGTGGHLFPGIAVAEAFQELYPDVQISFVGTTRGLEEKTLSKTPWPFFALAVPKIKGQGKKDKLLALIKLPSAMVKAALLLQKTSTDLVIGIGGYLAWPVSIAAFLLGKPVAIIEPNAVPGLSNRMLSKIARRIFLAFPEAEKYFEAKKCMMSGNPLRKALREASAFQKNEKNPFTLFCFGGSLGAKSLNQALLASLPLLTGAAKTIRIVHQVGKAENLQQIEAEYKRYQQEATVLEFIDDIASVYQQASLVLARSGAGTIAELKLFKKPAILVPYPFAADNHQHENAVHLEKKGAAIIIPQEQLTGDVLAMHMNRLFSSPALLEKMEMSFGREQEQNAAAHIAEECVHLFTEQKPQIKRAHCF